MEYLTIFIIFCMIILKKYEFLNKWDQKMDPA